MKLPYQLQDRVISCSSIAPAMALIPNPPEAGIPQRTGIKEVRATDEKNRTLHVTHCRRSWFERSGVTASGWELRMADARSGPISAAAV